MADATYPLIYRSQGATEFVVQSSGILSMDGSMDISGDVDLESGGSFTVASGASIQWPVSGATSSSIGSTTLTEFANNGVSFITSSGDTRKFTIADPVPGCDKWLYFTAGSTGMVHYISVGSAGIISTGASSTAHLMIREATTSHGLAGWCHLVGFSTSRWILMDHSPTSSFIIASTSS